MKTKNGYMHLDMRSVDSKSRSAVKKEMDRMFKFYTVKTDGESDKGVFVKGTIKDLEILSRAISSNRILHDKVYTDDINEEVQTITFQELRERSDSVTTMMAKELFPKKWLHWLKRTIHRKHYIGILKLSKTIMKDPNRKGVTPHMAIVHASKAYGIDPREMLKVLDKETRHA